MTQGRPVPAQTSTAHCTLHRPALHTLVHVCTGYSTAQMDSRSNGQAGNHDHTHSYRYHQHNCLLGWNYLETSLFWSKCMRHYQHSLPGSSYSIFLLLSWLSWSKSIIVFYVLLFHALSESFRAFQSLLWHFIIIDLSVLHRLWHKVFQNTKIVMKEPRNCANIYEQPLMTEAIRRRSQDLL